MPKANIKKIRKIRAFKFKDKQVYLGIFGSGRGYALSSVYKLVKDFNLANETNIRIISTQLAAYLTSKPNDEQDFDSLFTGRYTGNWHFPVDAIIGYEEPGKEFGEKIVYEYKYGRKLVFPTGSYKGKKNAALVVTGVNFDDFKVSKKGMAIEVPNGRLTCIGDFSTTDGWCSLHPLIAIPFGRAEDFSPGKKNLLRLQHSFVGRVTLQYGQLNIPAWHYVLTDSPSKPLRTIVEISEEDFEKIKTK